MPVSGIFRNRLETNYSFYSTGFSTLDFIKEDSKFKWNESFIAVSVGQSSIDAMRDYIKCMDYIHTKKRFKEEFEDIVGKYGFVM